MSIIDSILTQRSNDERWKQELLLKKQELDLAKISLNQAPAQPIELPEGSMVDGNTLVKGQFIVSSGVIYKGV